MQPVIGSVSKIADVAFSYVGNLYLRNAITPKLKALHHPLKMITLTKNEPFDR